MLDSNILDSWAYLKKNIISEKEANYNNRIKYLGGIFLDIHILSLLIVFIVFGSIILIVTDISVKKYKTKQWKRIRQMSYKMTPKEVFQNICDPDKNFRLMDVRSSKEFKRGHIKNAQNINVMDFKFMKLIKKLKKEQKFIIYGQGEDRSKRALDVMKKRGFLEIYIMTGGMLEWRMQDLPIEK